MPLTSILTFQMDVIRKKPENPVMKGKKQAGKIDQPQVALFIHNLRLISVVEDGRVNR